MNRNKKSVGLSFAHPAGVAVLHKLAATCDVLVENYLPGSLAKYGLDYARVAALNPALIYASITGYGQYGPYSNRAGYDVMVEACVIFHPAPRLLPSLPSLPSLFPSSPSQAHRQPPPSADARAPPQRIRTHAHHGRARRPAGQSRRSDHGPDDGPVHEQRGARGAAGAGAHGAGPARRRGAERLPDGQPDQHRHVVPRHGRARLGPARDVASCVLSPPLLHSAPLSLSTPSLSTMLSPLPTDTSQPPSSRTAASRPPTAAS